MIRDSIETFDRTYWDRWVVYFIGRLDEQKRIAEEPSGDPGYRPQYWYELAKNHYRLILYRYSRGDAVSELAQYFPGLLDAWEESERLGKAVWTDEIQYGRHAWAVNLGHYNRCFWLVGLALALNIPDDQWQRLLALIGNEGEDELLDRVIASRQAERKIGDKLCHPKPYQRLLDAIDAPKDKQAAKLKVFLDKWYPELNRRSEDDQVEWYGYHQYTKGAYYGYWCIEAVAAVKAFGLDDSLCLGHPNYPDDLLRPGGPSTHPSRPDSDAGERSRQTVPDNAGWFGRLFGKK